MRYLLHLTNESENKSAEIFSECSSPISRCQSPSRPVNGYPKLLSQRKFKRFGLKMAKTGIDMCMQTFDDPFNQDYVDDFVDNSDKYISDLFLNENSEKFEKERVCMTKRLNSQLRIRRSNSKLHRR